MKHIILSAFAATLLCACSGSATQSSKSAYTEEYNQGHEFADKMLSTWDGDTAVVQETILELHTICAEKEKKDGKFASQELRRGFSERVTELNPELAAKIF